MNITKHDGWLWGIAIAFLVLSLVCAVRLFVLFGSSAGPSVDDPLSRMRMQTVGLKKLTVLRISINDAVGVKRKNLIDNYWAIYQHGGEIDYSVDMGCAVIERDPAKANVVRMSLPEPEVDELTTGLNLEEFRLVRSFGSLSDERREELKNKAKVVLTKSLGSYGSENRFKEEAKASAVNMLRSFYRAIDPAAEVRIEWRGESGNDGGNMASEVEVGD